MTRLASNEIFSPSNKIHPEVGRAKDLSAPRYDMRLAVMAQCMNVFEVISTLVLLRART